MGSCLNVRGGNAGGLGCSNSLSVTVCLDVHSHSRPAAKLTLSSSATTMLCDCWWNLQVMDFLGSAAFSKAVQALDTKTGMLVCLKIIKVRVKSTSRIFLCTEAPAKSSLHADLPSLLHKSELDTLSAVPITTAASITVAQLCCNSC